MKIVFTGGGTMGHVALNLALIPYFKNDEIHYIGSNGFEKEILKNNENVIYHEIKAGKLRRYFSFDNVKDIFNVFKGIKQSKKILKEIKPNIVFSKGGFVSVPVVIAAKKCNIPVILHESDITMGLANKICKPYATKVLTTFKTTETDNKTIHVGGIVRDSVYEGNYQRGKDFTKFEENKKVLLVVGGSSGSKVLNDAIRKNLDSLDYNIIHICGKDNLEHIYRRNYREYGFLNNLNDIIAYSDLVVSRAGANAIFEFLAAKKPMLLIPLGLNQSRGDQILNSKYFKEKGYALELKEENIDLLVDKINELDKNKEFLIDKMKKEDELGKITDIVKIINDNSKQVYYV